ncbi:MAG: MBL fold metallo-hydrolase [Verrucomicrobiales bacterium]|nr:MBL fold metallo-hydrolase [Verrucomicrobiales bacterium]
MLELAILGSGSSGNSALVCLGETRVLVDAGLSAKQLCLRLESLGVDPNSLSGIILTHEHGDHTRGIDVFCRKRPLPVYATTHTCAVVRENVNSPVTWRPFESGSPLAIGEMKIESFSVPHDAVDPVGFVFRCKQSSIGILSDVGHVTRMIMDRLRGVDTLFTEANYDEVMLQNDTKRPWSTKQRISNRHGHLSNDQTADLVSAIAAPNLTRVVLGHLSSDCNTAELATSVIAKKLTESGFSDVAVECAERIHPLPLTAAARASKIPPAIDEEKPAKSARVCEPSAPEPTSDMPSDWKQTEWAF